MKWMFIAGGTAGHINPALALAKIAMQQDSSLEIVFVGTKDRLESKLVPEAGFRYLALDIVSPSGSLSHKIKGIGSLLKVYPSCLRLLKNEKVDVCVGFGNYISVPILLAAAQLKIPFFLHEQNSFPGKANRLLAKFASGIVTCFDENVFPKSKTRLLGNPQVSLLKELKVNREETMSSLGLDSKLPLVTIMLGSLGSSSVSKIVDDSLDYLKGSYQVLISTGQSNEYSYQHISNDRFKIVPYFDGKTFLSLSDLAITRAGATTIAELEALQVPAILIPSPYVANNHQEVNAQSLVKQGSAILLKEKELTSSSFSQVVNDLFEHPQELENMKKKAQSIEKKDPAKKMIAWIKESIHGWNDC